MRRWTDDAGFLVGATPLGPPAVAPAIAVPEGGLEDLRIAYLSLARTLEEKERDLVLAGELGQALLARYDLSVQQLEDCRQQARCLIRKLNPMAPLTPGAPMLTFDSSSQLVAREAELEEAEAQLSELTAERQATLDALEKARMESLALSKVRDHPCHTVCSCFGR